MDNTEDVKNEETEIYINSVIAEDLPGVITLVMLQQTTNECEVMQKVHDGVQIKKRKVYSQGMQKT